MSDSTQRYHGVAIGFHWLVAISIIGMLVVGKYMVSLDESEPLRFLLTQWHKSFGVITLVLIVLRLLWRLNHRPPRLPGHLKPWEIYASGLVHFLLYLLIILIPLSGWIMVSASPLELPTVIFNSIHWPHLAPFDRLPNKEDISAIFGEVHAIAGSVLILLLLAHVGAALRHQFVLHDEVMSRMSPKTSDSEWAAGVVPLTVTIVIIVVSLIVYGYGGGTSVPLGAGKSRVHFGFTALNRSLEGRFVESSVELLLDSNNPAANSLRATLNVSTITTGNSQVDATLLGSDWLDVKNHPQASFESTELVAVGEDGFSVSGSLRIKGVSRDLRFPLMLVKSENKRMATGSFTVNRLDFNLGSSSQPDEAKVAFPVEVGFEFEVQ